MLVFVFSILFCSSVSYAENKSDLDFSLYHNEIGIDHTEYDDNGYCVKGVVSYGFAGKDIVQVKWTSGKGLYIICDDTGSVNVYTFFDVDGYFDGYYVCTYTKAGKKTSTPTRYQNNNVMGLETDFFYSTIPVFNINDTDALNDYINNGDISGASNSDYINPPDGIDEFDGSIPLPHNLKVLQGADQSVVGDASTTVGTFCRDVVLSWEQNDVVDDMSYEIQFQSYAKRMPDDGQFTLQEHNGPYSTIITDTYNGSKTVTVSIDVSTLNSYKEKGFLTKQKFRVRNIVNGKTSNWVVVTIDIEKGKATANEEGYSDPDVDGGAEYDDNDLTGGTSNVSVDGIMQYVRDGFGLIGNGGLISLMSSTFLYLPNSTWTIFNFFVSSLVTIALLGAVIKIIF